MRQENTGRIALDLDVIVTHLKTASRPGSSYQQVSKYLFSGKAWSLEGLGKGLFQFNALRQVGSRRGGEVAAKSTPDTCLRGNWGMEICAGTGLKSLRNKEHHQEYNPLPLTLCLVPRCQHLQHSFNEDTSLSLPESYFASALALFSYIESFSRYRDYYTPLTKSSASPKCFIRPFLCLHLILVFPFSSFSFFFSLHSPSHYSS